MTERFDKRDFEQGVMLDVGPGAGALIIYTRDELLGEEIEISSKGADSQRVHTEVLRRKVAGGYMNAAVFGSLPEGDYLLWHDTLPGSAGVRIVSSEVTELDWR